MTEMADAGYEEIGDLVDAEEDEISDLSEELGMKKPEYRRFKQMIQSIKKGKGEEEKARNIKQREQEEEKYSQAEKEKEKKEGGEREEKPAAKGSDKATLANNHLKIPDSEFIALLDIYKSCGGKNWKKGNDWTSSAKKWTGVDATGGHVVKVDVTGFGLEGGKASVGDSSPPVETRSI